MKKSFEKLMAQLNGRIPQNVLEFLPIVLSPQMKNDLTEEAPEKVAAAVMFAIESINRGSVEKVEVLIRKHLTEQSRGYGHDL